MNRLRLDCACAFLERGGGGSAHAQCGSGGDVMPDNVEGENSETKAEKDVD